MPAAMWPYFLNLLGRALHTMPSLVSSNWAAVVMALGIFVLSQVFVLFFRGWDSMMRQWKENIAIGVGAVALGWVGLFVWSLIVTVYNDHESLVNNISTLEQERDTARGQVEQLKKAVGKGPSGRLVASGFWRLSLSQATELREFLAPQCKAIARAYIDLWRYDPKDMDSLSLADQIRGILDAACEIPTHNGPSHPMIDKADPFTGVVIFVQARDISNAHQNPPESAIILKNAFARIGFAHPIMYGEGVGKIAIVIGKKPL